MPYVHVHIDTEDVIREIDTEDLIAELERRGNSNTDPDFISVRLMFEAFYVGDDARAIALARQIAQAYTGRMLMTKEPA